MCIGIAIDGSVRQPYTIRSSQCLKNNIFDWAQVHVHKHTSTHKHTKSTFSGLKVRNSCI